MSRAGTLGTALLITVLAGCMAQPVDGGSDGSLLIVGLTTEQPLREAFEDATVDALERQGVPATASHTLVPRLDAQARRKLEAAARESDSTAVVAVRALGLSADGALVDQSPFPVADMAHLQTFYSIARHVLADAPAPDHEVLVVSVYSTEDQRLIWGGVTWTFDLDDWQARIREVSGLLADNISSAIEQRRQANRGAVPAS